MSTYICKWPDGTGTIISVNSLTDLFWELDVHGCPLQVLYKKLKSDLNISFKIKTIGVDLPETKLERLHDEDERLAEEFADKKGWKKLQASSFQEYNNRAVFHLLNTHTTLLHLYSAGELSSISDVSS